MAALKDPPLARGRYPGQLMLDLARDPLAYLTGMARAHGDIYFQKFGPWRSYLLNHPDLIQEVLSVQPQNFKKDRVLQMTKVILGEGLLTSEGEFHKRQRRLIQPAFHRQRVAGYAQVMVEKALDFSGKWKDGEALDINEEMMRLALAIVGKSLFGEDLQEKAGEIAEALGASLKILRRRMYIPFAFLWQRLPLPSSFQLTRASQTLDRIVLKMIAEHRARGVDNGDLLSMMLYAEDAEEGGPRMTDAQVRDEAVTLLLAGHETTANALTWTWYLLFQNPEVEEKLRRELDEVLEGRPPGLEDIPRLRYTEMVLSEALRLFPPAWVLGYEAMVSTKVGGYDIPKGANILMSQYVMHRDPRYYPDPLKFDPERFTPEAKASRPRFAYFPFGGGPRQCIGEPFAWMEGILLLATLAQRWKPRLVPGHPVEPMPSITLRPRFGMRMVLEERKPSRAAV